MRILSFLFGCNRKKGNDSKDKTGNGQTLAGTGLYTQLIDILVTDSSRQSSLKELIARAFADPQSFYDEDYEFTLSDRGLTYPKDSKLTPKFVLIDTMMEYNQMAEVDWKEEEENIRFAVSRIIKAKRYLILFSEANKYNDETNASLLIEYINERELKPAGYALLILDIDSDSYVFTVIPDHQQETATDIYRKLAN